MKNARLVFERGNQWSRDTDLGVYYAVPSWWRRFIFQVLTPREFVVYAYLAGIFDPNAIAYPTIEQIREDLGIRSAVIVSRAIDRLVELGFVLRGPSKVRGRLLSNRAVYQRPLPAYTLMRLLETRKIDAWLFPYPNAKGKRGDFTDSAVERGLRRTLGDAGYRAYRIASDSVRTEVLVQLLREKVAQAVIVAEVRFNALPPSTSAAVSALVAEGAGVPF